MTRTRTIGLAEIADMLGVAVGTARTYHTRAIANRRAGQPKPGDLPEPDYTIGRSPAWNQTTIEKWIATRPGKGRGPRQAARRDR